MGIASEPKPAKYFVALLFSDSELLTMVEAELCAIMGAIDGRSEDTPWTVSRFYDNEMGPALLRRFLSFAPLMAPGELAAIKVRTQQIENRFRRSTALSSGRRVNLDPGYIDDLKVVLASTKNASQRIYLGSGIYAESALHYHDGGFHGLPYTYTDYLWPSTTGFMTRLRASYLKQLRQAE